MLAEPQPCFAAGPTIVYTPSISALVISTAPGTSAPSRRPMPGSSGTSRRAASAVAMPIGRFTKKIQRQLTCTRIFFVNLPIGIATALAARRLVPDEPGIGLREGADVPGAVLITSALMLGVYTIVGPAAKQGWGSASTLLFGAGSIALMVSFLARETRAASPLMPLRIFRSRPVAAANAIQILSVAGMFGMFFLGALYLRRVLGYDALEIGLAFLPVTIAMGTLSIRYSERIFMALGARRALLAGLTLVLAGLVVFALAPVHADYATQVAPSMLLLGLGAGTAFPALMNLAMSGATPQDAGLASGLVNTTAQVGGALGLAVLATLSTSRSNALKASGHPIASALTSGYHLAFWVAAALVGCALAVVLASVNRGARARARRNTRRKRTGRPEAEGAGARGGEQRKPPAPERSPRCARARRPGSLTCRDGAQDEARQRALAASAQGGTVGGCRVERRARARPRGRTRGRPEATPIPQNPSEEEAVPAFVRLERDAARRERAGRPAEPVHGAQRP